MTGLETEFLDSMSGEFLVNLVDSKVGSTYDTATAKGKWDHAKKAFNQWHNCFGNDLMKRMGNKVWYNFNLFYQKILLLVLKCLSEKPVKTAV